MQEAVPDFGLPTSVETLDGGLEPCFVGCGEDRRDLQAEAETDDAANGIGMLPGTRESIVVVELDVSRQSPIAPMPKQCLDDCRRGDPPFGPHRGQPSVKRNSGENRHMRTAADGKPFDGIEAVQLARPRGHFGEIPTGRWRRTAQSFASVETSMTCENSSDGPAGGNEIDLSKELSTNGVGTELAQSAVSLESFSSRENTSLEGQGCPISLPGSGRSILPVDAIETLLPGPICPILNGRERHGKAPGYGAPRLSLANSGDHFATIGRGEFLCHGWIPGKSFGWEISHPCRLLPMQRTTGPRAVWERNSSRARPSFRSAPTPLVSLALT